MTDEAVPTAASVADSAAQPAPAKSSADKAHGRVNAAAVILLVFGGISALNTLAVMFWVVVAGAARAGRQGVVTFQTDGGFMNGGRPFTDGQGGGMPTVMGGAPADGHMLGFAFLALLIIGAAGAVIAGSQILAGVWILQRRAWGRLLGMVVSGMALVVLVVGLASALVWIGAWAPAMADAPRHMGEHVRAAFGAIVGFGAIVTLVLMLAYGWILFILARHEEAFEPMGGPQPTV